MVQCDGKTLTYDEIGNLTSVFPLIFRIIKGSQIAETMYERHTLLTDWLIFLGVDQKTAVEDACRVEHVISAQSFQAIKKHIQLNKELRRL